VTSREEIDLWFAEQVAIHGEPATDDDLGRIADGIMATHKLTPAHAQYMIAAENKRLVEEALRGLN
jgi:hypothetical protein